MIQTRCPECSTVAEHEVLQEEPTESTEREVLVRCITPGCGYRFTELLLVDI